MDFGIFYEIQVNSPLKHREREYQAFHDVLKQVETAEQVGYTHFWTVEHHFQVGFAHSSAPEVLYGAISQRTSKIRIGHAVVLLPFPYNHPVRVAERVATLDILSNGRVEVGTGRSATQIELGGFGIPYKETRTMGGSARHYHDHLEEPRRHLFLQRQVLRHSGTHRGADADSEAASSDVGCLHR